MMSGSGSLESSEVASITIGNKVGGQSIHSDSLRADSGSSTMSAPAISSSDSPPNKPNLIINEEINFLKETIKTKGADLRSLSEEIASSIRRQTQLLEKEVLSTSESRLLSVIEDINLPDMRQREKRFVDEIAKHETELSALINPKELVDAPVPAQGM